jgi:hypothetical protein
MTGGLQEQVTSPLCRVSLTLVIDTNLTVKDFTRHVPRVKPDQRGHSASAYVVYHHRGGGPSADRLRYSSILLLQNCSAPDSLVGDETKDYVCMQLPLSPRCAG